MPVILTPVEPRKSVKMRPDAAYRLRMLTAKLTIIFGRRITINETVDILTAHIDDTALDLLARNYATIHNITLPGDNS